VAVGGPLTRFVHILRIEEQDTGVGLQRDQQSVAERVVRCGDLIVVLRCVELVPRVGPERLDVPEPADGRCVAHPRHEHPGMPPPVRGQQKFPICGRQPRPEPGLGGRDLVRSSRCIAKPAAADHLGLQIARFGT
jgi:hypothetical protein